MGEIAAFLDAHTEVGRRYRFERILDELRRSLFHELDYRREAANLTRLGESLAEFERIVVPRPIEGYVTSRVLTMEYVEGRSIRDVGPLARLEMNGQDLAEQLFRAYLQQVLVDGFFHADPHPGNVFLTTDFRLALIDVGMVGLLGPEMQDSVVRLLLAMSEGRGRDVAETAMELGERTRDFDTATFTEEINGLVLDYAGAPARELQIGRLVLETTRAAAANGLLIPPQFTLLGKTLLNLDQVGRLLDPEFEPNAAIQRNAADLMRQRVLKSASPGNLFNSLLETNEFVQRLPRRLNRVLDAVSEREFEVRIRIANDNLIMDGLQKIANRIAAGAVLAALILAAALLMRVETAFRIVGYPGLAVILFLAAVAGGVILVVDVFTHDRWTRKDPPRG
jgi:ubiquinone biosynthesis protein